MSPRRRSLRREDDAVSPVLGALLVLAVIISFMAVVRVDFVPVWEGEAESQHLNEAERDLSRLSTALMNGGSSYSQAVSLTPTSVVALGPPRLPAQFGMTTELAGLQINAPEFTVTSQSSGSGDSQYANLPQHLDWTPVNDGVTIADIGSITELRYRILDLKTTDPMSTFTTSWTDAGGQVVATIDGSIDISTSVIQVELESRDSNGNVMGFRTDSVYPGTGPTDYYLDVMDSQFRIGATLANSNGPFAMSVVYDAGVITGIGDPLLGQPTMEFAMTYTNSEGVILGGGGTTQTAYSLVADTAHFAYDYTSLYAVDQDYVLEYGAILLVQPDGAIVKATPGFLLTTTGTDLLLQMTVPSSATPAARGSSSTTAVVSLAPVAAATLGGYSEDMTIRMATNHAAAWADHWTWSLLTAGLGDASGTLPGVQFTINADELIVQLSAAAVTPGANFDRVVVNVANPTYGVDIE